MMYPPRTLYTHYLKLPLHSGFSSALPDTAKRTTLEYMEHAIRFCEAWDSFIDIGGGSGHYAIPLAAIFKKGTVIDVSVFPEHAEIPKKFPNLTIVNKKIEDYSEQNNVDFILLADLFEHIPNIEAFADKIASLQSKGGVIYIMTPNPLVCGPAPESEIYHTRHEYGHIKHYAAPEIVSILGKRGYALMRLHYEEGPFRQQVKRIIRGFSRRDARWQKYYFYPLIRPFFLAVTIPFVRLLSWISYLIEKQRQNDDTYGMTQNLIFKKI